MKRTYTPPKAVHVDFRYEEQVKATSVSGNVSGYGDPNYTGYCQQNSPYTCTSFFLAGLDACPETAWSLRP